MMQTPPQSLATPSTPRLTLSCYWKTVGNAKLEQVLAASGTSLVYFKMMANFNKPCSVKKFEQIERAAKEITPGILPDYELCTRQSVRDAAIAAKKRQRCAASDLLQHAQHEALLQHQCYRGNHTAPNTSVPSTDDTA